MSIKERLQSLKDKVVQSKTDKDKIKSNYSGTLPIIKRIDRIEEILNLK